MNIYRRFCHFHRNVFFTLILFLIFNLPASAGQMMAGSEPDIPVQYYKFAGFNVAYKPGMPPVSGITIPPAKPSEIPATIEVSDNRVSGGIIGKGYPLATLGIAMTGDDDVIEMAEIGDAIRIVFDYPVNGFNVEVYKGELKTLDNTV